MLRVALMLAALGLAGCEAGVDRDRARVCRLAIPALNAADARFEITRTAPHSLPRSVAVTYRVIRPGAPARERMLICRFDPGGTSGALGLTGMATETGPVSDATFYFLTRFYLSSPEAAAADPAPEAR